MKKLKLLSITDNKIKRLGAAAFESLRSIGYIDLTRNLLTNIQDEAFYIQREKDDPQYLRLLIQSNKLETISELAFEGNTFPMNLDISFNNITTLSKTLYKPILQYYMSKVRAKGIRL